MLFRRLLGRKRKVTRKAQIGLLWVNVSFGRLADSWVDPLTPY
jgi:hypothetical protein